MTSPLARRFAGMVAALLKHVEQEEGDDGPALQLTIIYRNGYTPGPSEAGRWIVGYQNPEQRHAYGAVAWSAPFGTHIGATMYGAIEAFHDSVFS